MLLLIVIFGLIGLAFGGPVGLLIGGGLGWWLGRRISRRLNIARTRIQEGFLESIFSVMGCLCQADGKVTDGELDVAEKLFDQMRLQGEQRAKARAAFERGRADDFNLDAELANVNQLTQRQPVLRQVFIQVQLSAIAADGVLHPAEHDMILRVARGVGCSDAEVQQIEAMLHGAAANSKGASEEALKDAYRVLGISEDASDTEIKKSLPPPDEPKSPRQTRRKRPARKHARHRPGAHQRNRQRLRAYSRSAGQRLKIVTLR
ncbi:hypothetical protein HSBAA_62850 [Vreelandella sulfidaeris]|uniref:Co-chaperone DjlA N-terminal domain-containing protein n=1 Tax=Vreelandella sulfidaeris TaxID=115553 RepID=A0A455UL53_9GAMM|nr:hypothetical protein HSBAA_62850 [Halomonas sulfidaeris]